MVGKTLAHYEILEPLGAGGMGEVYRARDTKLERDVAIKVLPEDLADDPDRLARLQREAKLLAALNHPNIATVHALEGEEGASFLVLELVTGESLEQKLAKGPLPVEEALDTCKQIAEALEAAHGEGIIHRDLKPANVLVTPDGRAKVLDFGIAKSMQVDGGVAATAHATNLTVAGTLVGTPSYMSPEQVRGGAVDKRVDIWAFGCLLFEALTARSAFAKETMADTLAAIVDQEPDWNVLPHEISPQVRRLIERCLRKDPDGRLHDIADARIEIEEALGGGTDATSAEMVAAAGWKTLWKLAVPLAAASAFLGALGLWAMLPAPLPSESLSQRFYIDYPISPSSGNPRRFNRRTTLGVAISPDGSSVVFSAGDQLWLRKTDDLLATPIPGTAGATVPFFSPDGQRLGFWSPADGSFLLSAGEMKHVAITGGAPVSLGPAERPYGASWAGDDYIYFGQGAGGIWRVPEDGGEAPHPVIEIDEGEQAHGPQLLPDGEWLLFTLANGDDWNEAQIVVESLLTQERNELGVVGTDARYVPTGHIVYSRGGDLFAVLFDARSRQATGAPHSIGVEGVQQSQRDAGNRSIPLTGASQYAFSELGGLVYMPRTRGGPVGKTQLVWRDRKGDGDPLPVPPDWFWTPRLSPDGSRLAVAVEGDDGDLDIRVYNVAQGSSFPLTSEGSNGYPVWSVDGAEVYFDSNRGGDRDVWKMRVDQRGGAELVQGGEGRQTPYSVSDDGESLLFGDPFPGTDDILILSLNGPKTPEKVVWGDPETSMQARFSPDGLYFVFEQAEVAGENSPRHVYVQEVSTSALTLVSTGHARDPVWSSDGSEIFYRTASPSPVEIHVVAVTPGAENPFSPPTRLFDYQPALEGFTGTFDVTADGQRFLMLAPAPGSGRTSGLVIVLNWFEELKRLVPGGR